LETKWGNAIKVQMESLVLDLSKITKAKGIEEIVLTFVWLSVLPDTNSYFLDRVFYLNKTKMTIFTGSKHVL
jgi:hypothetical protein